MHFVLKRLLVAVPVLIGVSLVSFFIVRLVPGDTATAILGPRYTEEQAERIRERYALDEPLPVQYGVWFSRVVRGEFGESSYTGRGVLESIALRLPVTLELAALAVLAALLIGIPLGTLGAVRRHRPSDYVAEGVGLLGISIPNFWLGAVLILAFALGLGWLPPGGYTPFADDPLENLRSMLLPAIALGAAVAGVITRMTRSSMIDVLREDYVNTARAKGLPTRRVIFGHALKNALLPVVVIAGVQAAYLFSGSVVIEQVFSLPGLGRLIFQAVTSRDYQLLQGTVLFMGTVFVLANLVVDVLHGVLDPRTRRST